MTKWSAEYTKTTRRGGAQRKPRGQLTWLTTIGDVAYYEDERGYVYVGRTVEAHWEEKDGQMSWVEQGERVFEATHREIDIIMDWYDNQT